MGLDIFGHLYKKTRTRNEDESLRDYMSELEEQADKASMEEAKAAIKKGIADMKKAKKEGKLFPFAFSDFDYAMKLYFPYDFQRNGLKDAKDIKTVEEWAKKIDWKTYYKPCDFYFRKVNCIYAYFQDRLEEEACEVTKEDVIDIMERATKVLAAHNQETAKELLPTQAGFFFGSTDYDDWYYYDMKEILKEFGELLMRWKEDDICFVDMSW